MELITSFLRLSTSSAVNQSGTSTSVDTLIAALLVSLLLVVGSSWWIFRSRSR